MSGTLTIRGTSKQVKFDVEFGGQVQDPWGNTRVGFTVTGKIRRKDFGVNFGLSEGTEKVMLSDDVRVSANVQFVKQAAE